MLVVPGCASIPYDLPTRTAYYSCLTRPCRLPIVSKQAAHLLGFRSAGLLTVSDADTCDSTRSETEKYVICLLCASVAEDVNPVIGGQLN